MKRVLGLACLLPLLTGCQIFYLANNSYQQLKLMNARVPIEKALADPKVSNEVKRKLKLVQEVLKFGSEKLGLNTDKNYRTYVDIGRPYVTWIVQAAKVDEIRAYTWWFPVVGRLPYKGYFSEAEAKAEAKKFDPTQYDTNVRGASAYSTLGWFHDPVLSSMMRYDDTDLVSTILHESVHATLFIQDHGDFNERLANFFGNKGAELFYESLEGKDSPTVKQIRMENADHLLFSKWISQQIEALREFYKTHKTPDEKIKRLAEFQTDFAKSLKPQLKTSNFDGFSKLRLNNAVLLNYTTYDQNLSDFEAFYAKVGDYREALKRLRSLAKSKDPNSELKRI